MNMEKLLIKNKKAYFDFFIIETYECGIELKGAEVKSIVEGRVSIKEAWVKFKEEQAFIVGMNISPYPFAKSFKEDPLRERKLLLHKKEIIKISTKIKEKGLTVLPLKIYIKNKKIKLEIGIVKAKKLYDKREEIKKREERRQIKKIF